MIFVLLGTQNNSFYRLLDEIENCINKNIITDKVIVQAGYTNFISNKIEVLDFVSGKKLNELITSANLVISHGGVGSILSAIKLNKKLIAVPRFKKYKEHVNDHQIQIVKSFDEQGYLKGVFNLDDLGTTIKNINSFMPEKYISNTDNFLNVITNYINNN